MSPNTFVCTEGAASSPPLVLIHGVGLDHHMWDLVVERLAATHFVVRYDLLGHGESEDPPGSRTLDDFTDQLLDVLDMFGFDAPAIVGLSIGGMITLGFGARHPDRVGKAGLITTVFGRTEVQKRYTRERLALTEAEGMAPVAELGVNRWFTSEWQAAHPDRAEAIRQRLLTNDLEGYLKAYRVFVEGDPLMPEGARHLTAPSLALTGEYDPGSTPAMSESLAAALPNGQALILPERHHIPPVECPDEFVDALLPHLLGGNS